MNKCNSSQSFGTLLRLCAGVTAIFLCFVAANAAPPVTSKSSDIVGSVPAASESFFGSSTKSEIDFSVSQRVSYISWDELPQLSSEIESQSPATGGVVFSQWRQYGDIDASSQVYNFGSSSARSFSLNEHKTGFSAAAAAFPAWQIVLGAALFAVPIIATQAGDDSTPAPATETTNTPSTNLPNGPAPVQSREAQSPQECRNDEIFIDNTCRCPADHMAYINNGVSECRITASACASTEEFRGGECTCPEGTREVRGGCLDPFAATDCFGLQSTATDGSGCTCPDGMVEDVNPDGPGCLLPRGDTHAGCLQYTPDLPFRDPDDRTCRQPQNASECVSLYGNLYPVFDLSEDRNCRERTSITMGYNAECESIDPAKWLLDGDTCRAPQNHDECIARAVGELGVRPTNPERAAIVYEDGACRMLERGDSCSRICANDACTDVFEPNTDPLKLNLQLAILAPVEGGYICREQTSELECRQVDLNQPFFINGGCVQADSSDTCRFVAPSTPIYVPENGTCRAAVNHAECQREHGDVLPVETDGACLAFDPDMDNCSLVYGLDMARLNVDASGTFMGCAQPQTAEDCEDAVDEAGRLYPIFSSVMGNIACRAPMNNLECLDVNESAPIYDTSSDICRPAANQMECNTTRLDETGMTITVFNSLRLFESGMCREVDSSDNPDDTCVRINGRNTDNLVLTQDPATGAYSCRLAVDTSECETYTGRFRPVYDSTRPRPDGGLGQCWRPPGTTTAGVLSDDDVLDNSGDGKTGTSSASASPLSDLTSRDTNNVLVSLMLDSRSGDVAGGDESHTEGRHSLISGSDFEGLMSASRWSVGNFRFSMTPDFRDMAVEHSIPVQNWGGVQWRLFSGYQYNDNGDTRVSYYRGVMQYPVFERAHIYARSTVGRLQTFSLDNEHMQGFAAGARMEKLFSRDDSHHIRLESPFDDGGMDPRLTAFSEFGGVESRWRLQLHRRMSDTETNAFLYWRKEL